MGTFTYVDICGDSCNTCIDYYDRYVTERIKERTMKIMSHNEPKKVYITVEADTEKLKTEIEAIVAIVEEIIAEATEKIFRTMKRTKSLADDLANSEEIKD